MTLAGNTTAFATPAAPDVRQGPDVLPFVATGTGNSHSLNLLVEGLHCGGCVAKIEKALNAEPDVTKARVNLSTRRLSLAWTGSAARGASLATLVDSLGFKTVPFAPERLERGDADAERRLLRCLAVAGFAAANVMLLSVSIWAGHADGEMGPATRSMLHWFSALIALPAIAYAGLPFYRSALAALRHGHTNMDAPISLGILLAAGISLSETIQGGPHTYFESAVMLLFFLLVGRYLDKRARGKARAAAARLLALTAATVTVLEPSGRRRTMPPDQVPRGARVLVTPGERIAVDGIVETGSSDLDVSAISGESVPAATRQGDRVFAGSMNLTGALTLKITATGADTLLSEIVRLMEAAEQRKNRYVALADRISRAYAPVVHGLALATFLGWAFLAGAGWQQSLLIAVAVLIITCPCALGLAVPVVQVIASGRLLQRGILLKSATALERLQDIDTVVFDKTGTLTEGHPELIDDGGWTQADLAAAASLAAASRHPLARALCRRAGAVISAGDIEEHPGAGLSRAVAGGVEWLGSKRWCGAEGNDGAPHAGPELWFTRPGLAPVRFRFVDALRADAADVVAALRRAGLGVHLLSGDRAAAVEPVAQALEIENWHGGLSPADKVARLHALGRDGCRVLMVGDGLNDAPALAAAGASISPASASDIAQTAADVVFQGDRLAPVTEVLTVAQKTRRLVRQNFALALGYNVVTVPIAVLGFVTPLIAAVAMSASSVLVVSNALRLARRDR